MQPILRRLAIAALIAMAVGCRKEMSSDERLDRETSSGALEKAAGADDIRKINCKDVEQDLTKARNENRPENERVQHYTELYESLKKKSSAVDEAMTRNPDLAYQEGSQQFVEIKELCVQTTADVRVEFERYVRELVDVPTVQEIKGGSTVTVARLDYQVLRDAIEALSPDDKEQLLSRVANAEKKVEPKSEGAGRKRTK